MKETWKIINCLINKKVEEQVTQQNLIAVRPKSQVAKILLIVSIMFLVKIGPYLANDIPKSNDTFSTYLTDAVGDTLFLKPVTKAEIINLVNNTKSKKSKDHDDIDMCLVKKLIPYLVIPLEHIFSISLQAGVVPDSMKIARVIPLFKNCNINDFYKLQAYIVTFEIF